MPQPSFPESIAFERGHEPLREPFLGASNVIRRRLLHGEALTADQVAELTGKTPGLLGATMRLMEKWGFKFETIRRVDGQLAHRLVNREHAPTERDRPSSRPRTPGAPPASPKLTGLPRGFNTPARRNVIAALHQVGGTITAPSGDATDKLGQLLGGTYAGLSGLLAGMERDDLITRDKISPKTNQPAPKRMYGYALNYRHRYVRSLVGGRPLEPVPSNNAEPVDDGPDPEPLGGSLERVELPVGGEVAVRETRVIDTVATMPSELMPPPQVDQDLQVYMVFRDPDDGSVKVGIKNGSSRWLATIDGHVDADNPQV